MFYGFLTLILNIFSLEFFLSDFSNTSLLKYPLFKKIKISRNYSFKQYCFQDGIIDKVPLFSGGFKTRVKLWTIVSKSLTSLFGKLGYLINKRKATKMLSQKKPSHLFFMIFPISTEIDSKIMNFRAKLIL